MYLLLTLIRTPKYKGKTRGKMSGNKLTNLLKFYFTLGLKHHEILAFLTIHKIYLSHRSLKRLLRKLKLYRRKHYSDSNTLSYFIRNELSGSGSLHGYRWLHLRCIQAGFTVKQETVRTLLKILDPCGVSARKRGRLRRRQYNGYGPNFIWHMDSYDKLKPYGIGINGCIDGFSRKIVWIKASSTTNNPKVIAGFYLEAVKGLKGCPLTVRSDMGTENGYVENMQIFLRENSIAAASARPAFLYGTSPANQRIECWWSILRKHNSQFWINLFEMIKDDGYFSGSFLDKSLIQFCFLEVIQDEIDQIQCEWNAHNIRKTKNNRGPSGRPLIMYNLPELFGTENFLGKLNDETIISHCESECWFLTEPCDKDVFDLCNIIMTEMGLVKAQNPYNAVDLYIKLRSNILILL